MELVGVHIEVTEEHEPSSRRDRAATRTAVAMSVVYVACMGAGVFLAALNRSGFGIESFLLVAAFTAFMAVGALVVARRPGNALGWIYASAGLLAGSGFLAMEIAQYAYVTRPGALPGAVWAAWYAQWYWYPLLALLVFFTPSLFPTGTPLSPRWRPVLWVAAVVTAAITVLSALAPSLQLQDVEASVANPIGVAAVGDVEKSTAGSILFVIFLACLLAGLASLVLRYRRSRGEERQQLKWFCYAAVLLVLVPIQDLLPLGQGIASHLSDVLFGLTIVLLPVATGLAILKYRLYDIDVVINKTLVFGALAGFITLVYVAVVVGIGSLVGRGADRPNLALSIAATALVAMGFGPVKQRVQRVANHLVYGKRATPYEVLSEFSRRMGNAYADEDLVPRMARILAEGTGAARARVWLRVGADLRPEAVWPATEPLGMPVPVADGDAPQISEVSLALGVRDRDEMLGALTLTKPAGERLTPAEEHLARDLASQAGLVLRNVRLTEELLLRLEELQESRRRIVAAQDQERRRLERNIHDGAQQQLVALAVKVRLARQLGDRDPVRASGQLEDVEAELGQALEDLRDLARGIYPPLLADQGLGAALRSQATKAALPVTVEADGLGRYAQDREAAVYFCCLEALQNVAKYAGAASVVVRVREQGGDLVFTVTDDGSGFDPASTGYGTGLRGMADRLEALGGDLRVNSAPGRGTVVIGRLPLAEPAEPARSPAGTNDEPVGATG